ncbi:MAG: nitrilase-related carbon-nitrogen hydrolase [Dysosmobacter sp.]
MQECPELVLGFEICEDLWAPEAPSVHMAQAGATVIGNLSASNEVLGKADYRRQLVSMQSAKLLCGYVYASAGEGESTSDVVFGGHQLIAENGALLGEKRFENGLLISEIDVQKLGYERRRTQVMDQVPEPTGSPFSLTVSETKLTRYVAPMPFVPEGKEDRDERCREILLIASLGLKQRLEHTGAKTAVVGLSGGLDSTLAVLITGLAMKMLDRPMTGYRGGDHAVLRHHRPHPEQRRGPGGKAGRHAAHRGYFGQCPQPLQGHRPRYGGPLRHL